MRFTSYNNCDYTLNINAGATVFSVMKMLAEEIDKPWTDIVLIFENTICFPNELIGKYEIGEDDYVLFDWNEEYREFNRKYLDGKFGLDRNSFDLEQIGGGPITVAVKENYIDRYKSNFWRFSVQRYNDVTFQSGEIDVDSFLSDSQIKYSFNGGGHNLNIVPININRESFKLDNVTSIDLSQIISDISNRINVPPSLIELFSQRQSISQYKIDNSNIINLLNSQNINIYYDIISDKIDSTVSLVSINIKGQSFDFCCDNYQISSIIEFLSNQIDILKSFLALFYDRNKTNRIKGTEISKLNKHKITRDSKDRIIIYYYIREIIENFIPNKLLGEGAFGTVYKCTEIGSNKIFAIKMFEITEQKKDSFNKELSVIKSLDHPRIVRFERQIDTYNILSLLMEYMPGGSLGSYVRKNSALPEHKIVKYSKQILEGLQYLHNKNIIHRDIKGDNILLDDEDNIKLCDFGLAKCLTKIASSDSLNGVVKSTVGTSNWMAPEIICSEPYGFAIDIWSFGATLVEMVTGRIPFYECSIPLQVIFKIGIEKRIDFTYPEDVNENLKEFINHCLQEDPSKRATINDLLNHQFLVDT